MNGYIGVAEGQSKKIATYGFVEDTNEVHIERTAEGYGVLTLPINPQISAISSTGVYPNTAIDCLSKARVIIKTTYEDTSTYCSFRIVFYDSNGVVIGMSDDLTVMNLAIADSARYLGDMVIIANDCGASTVKLRVTSLTGSGDVSMFIGVI